jgi:tetratricopeptide (TPR) repeat protein
VGAVFLVFAMAVIAEGKFVPFAVAFSGGFVSLLCTWFLGKVVRGSVRKRLYDLAVAEHSEALRDDPASPAGHHNQGLASHGSGDFARAIAHFDAAIRLDPALADAHVGRVNAYGAIGQYERVIAEYTAVIERDPGNAVAFIARATACNGLGRAHRSIPDATEAIRLAPEVYLGHDARGWGHLQRGYQRAFMRLGFRTAAARDDYCQAVADFTEAIRLMPAAWDCYDGRSRALRALGDRAGAAADLARARELRGGGAPGCLSRLSLRS